MILHQSCSKADTNKLPDCTITSPKDGDIFTQGDSVQISVSATDEDGEITEVGFSDNGAEFARSTGSPYSTHWNTSNESSGIHIIKATAHDNEGAKNSSEISVTLLSNFPCGDTLVDSRNNEKYATVQIDQQCWMAENLNIGIMINEALNQTDNAIIEKYCYGNDDANCDEYGGFYQWDEMMGHVKAEGSQGICPTGWHLPTEADWCSMTTFLDPTVDCNMWFEFTGTDVGGKLKESGTEHWNFPNTGADNSSGFRALGAGFRHYTGYITSHKNAAMFWSSSEYSPMEVYGRMLASNKARIYRYRGSMEGGLSVRCIKN